MKHKIHNYDTMHIMLLRSVKALTGFTEAVKDPWEIYVLQHKYFLRKKIILQILKKFQSFIPNRDVFRNK